LRVALGVGVKVYVRVGIGEDVGVGDGAAGGGRVAVAGEFSTGEPPPASQTANRQTVACNGTLLECNCLPRFSSTEGRPVGTVDAILVTIR
jgi:hypothetical protein